MCSNRPQNGVYLDPNDVINNISTALLHMIWITTKITLPYFENLQLFQKNSNFSKYGEIFFVVIQIMCKSAVDMLLITSFGSK